MELWKEIKDFDGYWVSSEGSVWSDKRNKFLKAHTNRYGYLQVCFWQNGKHYYPTVHRLVAQAFIENPENKAQIDHINAVKTDNRVENLRWCTAKENINFKSDEAKRKALMNLHLRNKKCAITVLEKINDEVTIAYPSLSSVPGIDKRTLSNHTRKGEVEFVCKDRTFICADNVLQ